jgi:hypothetical protein
MEKKEDASKREKWQLVEFHHLNEVMVGNSHPLLLISDILGALGKAQYYTIDFVSGFHQVPLQGEDC